MNYYNEWDKKAAAWLRELMGEGLIPMGVVDDRSIKDVRPADLRGFTQCHFFTGIAGWPHGLRLAGWPEDRPVWTGSCPCQSFSSAGVQRGFDDERHLWPWFHDLIAAVRPPCVFGEQVEAATRVGDENQSWLDLVAHDLGKAGYAFGAAVFPAAYVGAFHKRERIYFVGHADGVPGPAGREHRGAGLVDGFWTDAEWIECGDGKRVAAKPGLRPLVDGIPEHVGLLRGAGNAIVPQQAAEFIAAYMEIM